jgi:hypothetical protein
MLKNLRVIRSRRFHACIVETSQPESKPEFACGKLFLLTIPSTLPRAREQIVSLRYERDQALGP